MGKIFTVRILSIEDTEMYSMHQKKVIPAIKLYLSCGHTPTWSGNYKPLLEVGGDFECNHCELVARRTEDL